MPKQRITKEMIVNAAFDITRKDGLEKVTVKSIADKLGCSVQPIYSYCQNMEGLRNEVAEKARTFVQKYIIHSIHKEDLFRSTGQAYIKIAKEEPHIFRLYLFQERPNVSSLNDLYHKETNPAMAGIIAKNLHISVEQAKQLHLNMLIYTIGIGTIFSVTSSSISEEEIFQQHEKAYQAFLNNIREGIVYE